MKQKLEDKRTKSSNSKSRSIQNCWTPSNIMDPLEMNQLLLTFTITASARRIFIEKKGSSGDSSTKEVAPSSCRELSMIAYILDGLYLVQNPDTKKVETVFCTFGITSSKSITFQIYKMCTLLYIFYLSN